MSLLEQVHSGRRHRPPRMLIYGTEGIGKSTLAAEAPNPIFVPTEDGLDQIECDSFPLAQSFDDVLAYLKTLAAEDHEYQTVVIDSADWLERLIGASATTRSVAVSESARAATMSEFDGNQTAYAFSNAVSVVVVSAAAVP